MAKIKESKSLGLNGKVKSVQEVYNPAIDFLGDIIVDKESSEDSHFQIQKFDSNGNLIRFKIENSSGDSCEEYYEYDEIGNRAKTTVIGNTWYNHKEILCHYSSQNRLTEVKVYHEGSVENYKYFYDINGYLHEEKHYNYTGRLFRITKYQNDLRGNAIKKSEFDHLGNLLQVYTYRFDDDNRKIEEIQYDANYNIISKNTIKFDEDSRVVEDILYHGGSDEEFIIKKYCESYISNNETQITFFDSENHIDETYIRKYECINDQNENWIKKYCFKNGVATHIFTRKILYYGD